MLQSDVGLSLEEKAEPPQAMNALMRLNQLKPGLQYKLVSQAGPVHAPIFTMSVEVDGSSFEASGPSKKTAKLHVAVKVGWAAVLCSLSLSPRQQKHFLLRVLLQSHCPLFKPLGEGIVRVCM